MRLRICLFASLAAAIVAVPITCVAQNSNGMTSPSGSAGMPQEGTMNKSGMMQKNSGSTGMQTNGSMSGNTQGGKMMNKGSMSNDRSSAGHM